MKDIFNTYSSKLLEYNDALGLGKDVPLGNMGFCNISANRRLVAVRQFNYKLHWYLPKGEKAGLMGDFLEKRAYYFIVTDLDFNFIRRVDCNYPKLWALEDIRLMNIGGNIIQASATDVSFGDSKYRMCSCRFKMCGIDDDGPTYLEALDSYTFPTVHEHNYIPIEGSVGLFITDIESNKFKMASIFRSEKRNLYCSGLYPIRGSTPLIKYRAGYIAVVHTKIPKKNRYINRFMFCDDKMAHCKFSEEFTVNNSVSPINFLCGMSIEDGKAILPFCVNDRLTYLFKINLNDFLPR